MKKVLTFIIILIPWFIGSLFQDNSFYESLNLPSFAPKSIIFAIVWPILFILLAISIYMIYSEYKVKDDKYYYRALLVNYIFNQSFTLVFFTFKSPFLGLVATMGTFISSLFLFNETYRLNKKASYFLIPYIIWNIFATILSCSIFLLNI